MPAKAIHALHGMREQGEQDADGWQPFRRRGGGYQQDQQRGSQATYEPIIAIERVNTGGTPGIGDNRIDLARNR